MHFKVSTTVRQGRKIVNGTDSDNKLSENMSKARHKC